jgi:hypothetical protein
MCSASFGDASGCGNGSRYWHLGSAYGRISVAHPTMEEHAYTHSLLPDLVL